MRSFFSIAKLIQPDLYIYFKFFESLIIIFDKYRLSSEHKSKNNLEIKKIIENAHREITQDQIKEYLNNK